MGNYNRLKQAVAAIVRKNGRQEITGTNLQATLFGLIDSLGKYRTYAGIAKPLTEPKSPDQNIFYFALQGGRYNGFGVDVADGLSVIYSQNDKWVAEELFTFDKVATKEDIEELRKDIEQELRNYLTREDAAITYATKDEVRQGDETLRNEINAESARLTEEIKSGDELSEQNLLRTKAELAEERKAGDLKLQKQIDTLINRSDVVDVVASYAKLLSYDVSKITINDVIKVLKDESRRNEITYYRLTSVSPKNWDFIGSLGAVYTKEEADAIFITTDEADSRFMEREAIDIYSVVNVTDVKPHTDEVGNLVYNEKSGKFAVENGEIYYNQSSRNPLAGTYPQFGRIYKTYDRLFIGTIDGLSELNKTKITTY